MPYRSGEQPLDPDSLSRAIGDRLAEEARWQRWLRRCRKLGLNPEDGTPLPAGDEPPDGGNRAA